MKLRTKASLFLSLLLPLVLMGQAVYSSSFWKKRCWRRSTCVRRNWSGSRRTGRLDTLIQDGQDDLSGISRRFPPAALRPGHSPQLEEHLRSAFIDNAMFDSGFFILDREGRGLADYPVSENFRGRA
ncbi:MAG: hypothetical protein MUF69_14000, partial [Desulfobacterota bacterium]|nr:hypothetical protein [Thermodesulfobacteriota bacterium]